MQEEQQRLRRPRARLDVEPLAEDLLDRPRRGASCSTRSRQHAASLWPGRFYARGRCRNAPGAGARSAELGEQQPAPGARSPRGSPRHRLESAGPSGRAGPSRGSACRGCRGTRLRSPSSRPRRPTRQLSVVRRWATRPLRSMPSSRHDLDNLGVYSLARVVPADLALRACPRRHGSKRASLICERPALWRQTKSARAYRSSPTWSPRRSTSRPSSAAASIYAGCQRGYADRSFSRTGLQQLSPSALGAAAVARGRRGESALGRNRSAQPCELRRASGRT